MVSVLGTGRVCGEVYLKGSNLIPTTNNINETGYHDSYCKQYGDAAEKRYKYQCSFCRSGMKGFEVSIVAIFNACMSLDQAWLEAYYS